MLNQNYWLIDVFQWRIDEIDLIHNERFGLTENWNGKKVNPNDSNRLAVRVHFDCVNLLTEAEQASLLVELPEDWFYNPFT